MKLEALLRAIGSMKVERPPVLWDVGGGDIPFLHVLAEMIALGLTRGTELGELVLNVSNVVVEPDSAGDLVPAGEFVAVTVPGGGDWSPEASWAPGRDAGGLLARLTTALSEAGCRYAYTRVLGTASGSVTAWLPRLV